MKRQLANFRRPMIGLGLACLAALLLATQAMAVELITNGDVGVEESQPDDIQEASKDRIQVRSNTDAGRQNVGYIRFDLAGFGTIDNAKFQIVHSNTRGWATGQVQVYGMNDVAGNSPQDWVETVGMDPDATDGWTYSKTGAELGPDGNALTQDLGTIGTSGTENLWALGDLPGVPSGGGFETIDFSSSELLNFLNSRAGGLATLILVNSEGTNRELLFASKELGDGSFAPKLFVNVPEPATVGLLLAGLAGLAGRRRS